MVARIYNHSLATMFKQCFIFWAGFVICLPTLQAQYRIGYINSDDVIQAMPEYVQMQSSVDSLHKAYQDVMDGMHKQYDELEKELEYQNDSTPDSVNQVKLNKLQDLQDAIKDMESRANDDMQKLQDGRMDELKDKYLKAVSTVAHLKGYAYILDAASDAVVCVTDPKDDITAYVFQQLGIKSTPAGTDPGIFIEK